MEMMMMMMMIISWALPPDLWMPSSHTCRLPWFSPILTSGDGIMVTVSMMQEAWWMVAPPNCVYTACQALYKSRNEEDKEESCSGSWCLTTLFSCHPIWGSNERESDSRSSPFFPPLTSGIVAQTWESCPDNKIVSKFWIYILSFLILDHPKATGNR